MAWQECSVHSCAASSNACEHATSEVHQVRRSGVSMRAYWSLACCRLPRCLRRAARGREVVDVLSDAEQAVDGAAAAYWQFLQLRDDMVQQQQLRGLPCAATVAQEDVGRPCRARRIPAVDRDRPLHRLLLRRDAVSGMHRQARAWARVETNPGSQRALHRQR